MLSRRSVAVAVLAPVLAAVGCQNVAERTGKSPLKPVQMSSDSSVLEVFKILVPLPDAEAAGAVWNEVDEQQIAAEARQRLSLNGFRVGVAASQVPVALAGLMELKGKPVPNGHAAEVKLAALDTEPHVLRSRWELRSGTRREILCSDVQDDFVVLLSETRGVHGQSYPKGQAVLAVHTFPAPDGRVRLRLVPEVHFGNPRMQYSGEQGVLRFESSRPKNSFDQMAMETTLSPGQLLVVGSLAGRSGSSLGHQFFTRRKNGKAEQQFVVVRLAQTQNEELFNPEKALPLEGVASADPSR